MLFWGLHTLEFCVIAVILQFAEVINIHFYELLMNIGL